MIRSFGRVCVKGAIPLHMLRLVSREKFVNVQYKYLRTLKDYCIVFGFRFLNSNAKYRLK